MGAQIIKGGKCFLAILGFYKVYNFFVNRFGLPRFYDVFLAPDMSEVRLVAPFYALAAYRDIRCELVGNGSAVEAEAAVVADPERGCLIVSFGVSEALRSSDLRVRLMKGRHAFFDGLLSRGEEKVYRLAITTLFKYEIEYLAEWIEHHARQGVEHFFLYDNNREDDIRALSVLKPYIDRGLVTYRRWPYPYVIYHFGLKPVWPNDSYSFTQSAQVNHAVYSLKGRVEWLLYCDVDEYVYAPDGANLRGRIQALAAGREVSALQIPGKWFGSRNADFNRLAENGVQRTFLWSEAGFASPRKCVFHLPHVVVASIHKTAETNGGEEIAVSPADLRFNHYRALGWKNRRNPSFAAETENRDILQLTL